MTEQRANISRVLAATIRPQNRRVAVRRLSAVVGTLVAVWAIVIVGLGYLGRAGDTCASCHTMLPYEAAGADSDHGTLACDDCHRALPGAIPIADGARMQRWVFGEVSGATPAATSFDDQVCRSCHAESLAGATVGNGIRVSHAEFLDRPCLDCHGGTAHSVEQRVYSAPMMDECVECHPPNPAEPSTCDYCHVPGADVTRYANSAYAVTHGPGWETNHALGDMGSCVSCHAPSRCADCHGIPLPHGGNWARTHGASVLSASDEGCVTCHEVEWCTDCHAGIEMPHATGFLRVHYKVAQETDGATCKQCHTSQMCDDCHALSEHPRAEGVVGHEGVLGR